MKLSKSLHTKSNMKEEKLLS